MTSSLPTPPGFSTRPGPPAPTGPAGNRTGRVVRETKETALLVELDLDFIITSERLWGCFPTVPSLHIYECLRDPGTRGVATVHFTWDGRHKRLVGV